MSEGGQDFRARPGRQVDDVRKDRLSGLDQNVRLWPGCRVKDRMSETKDVSIKPECQTEGRMSRDLFRMSG
jgi:hypothetical protein